MQPSMFESAGIPETQRAAWEQPGKAESRMKVLEMIRKADLLGGATLFELVGLLGVPVNCISGRVTELRKAGLVFDSGTRRTNPQSQMKGIVWRATPRSELKKREEDVRDEV